MSCFWGTQESSEPRGFLATSAELLFKCNCLYSPSPSRLETVLLRLCLRSLPQCILVRQGYVAPRAGAGRRGTARVAMFGNSSALLLRPAYRTVLSNLFYQFKIFMVLSIQHTSTIFTLSPPPTSTSNFSLVPTSSLEFTTSSPVVTVI